MARSAAEFRRQAIERQIGSWHMHSCSICNYPCAYVFFSDGEEVLYDSGCDCVRYPSPPRPRTWENVAEHYNLQGNPETIKRYDEFWGFGLEKVESEMVKTRTERHEASPKIVPTKRQREAFEWLAEKWREETQYHSSLTKISGHPAYGLIIDLGPPAIPLILESLEKRFDHWFFALRQLTGLDPAESCEPGVMKDSVEAWIKWGRERGYI